MGRPTRTSIGNRKSKIGNAFTLIEMLVVIAIILALLGILIGAVGAFSGVASSAASQQMMAAIEMGLKNYESDFGAYPPSMGTVAGYGTDGGHILAGVLLGPGAAAIDGKLGMGIASNGKTYGPYLSMKHDSTLQGSGTARWISMADSPGKKAVLYYKFNRTGGNGKVIGAAGGVWSNSGRFDTDHNNALDGSDDPTAYFTNGSLGDEGFASVSQRDGFAASLRANQFLIVYAGPDDKYGTSDDLRVTGK